MNKYVLLNKLSKDDDKHLIGKILDKYQYCIQKNKITNTNFLNEYQKNLIQKSLAFLKISNYLFVGAYENCERTILIFYPEKFSQDIVNSNLNNIISIIRIILPKELYNAYTHRDYLGAIMKLGIEREKVGDILVFADGADIIICNDMKVYLINNLTSLTRFKKSKIDEVKIESLRTPVSTLEKFDIYIPSMRLDCILAELLRCSRSKACEFISNEKIFVNFSPEINKNKLLRENDILTIRGKGRFKIGNIIKNTKKGNIILSIYKYK